MPILPGQSSSSAVPYSLMDAGLQVQSPIDIAVQEREAQRQREEEEAAREYQAALAGEDKPLFLTNPGEIGQELWNIAGNSVIGAVTDYADLVAGVIDVGKAATGNMDWQDVFNDADNSWVQWRRRSFTTKSKAGRILNTIARVGVALAAGGIVAKGAKAATLAAPGKLFGATSKIATQFDDFAKALGQFGRVGLSDDIAKIATPGPAKRAAQQMLGFDDLMRASASDFTTRATQAGFKLDGFFPQWGAAIKNGLGLFNPNIPAKVKLRTLGEYVMLDLFVDFMVAGEGDVDFEETLGDTLQMFDVPFLNSVGSLTMTRADDSYMTIKAKNALEGFGIGLLLKPMYDIFSMYRFARTMRSASSADQLEILARVQGMDFNDAIRQSIKQRSAIVPVGRTAAGAAQPGVSPDPYETLKMYGSAVEEARATNAAVNNLNWRTLERNQQLVDWEAGAREQVEADYQAALARRRPAGMNEEAYQESLQRARGGRTLAPGAEPGLIEGTPPGQAQLPPGARGGEMVPSPGGGMVPSPGGELGTFLDYRIEPTAVTPLRPPEPTITPQTLRSALREAIEEARVRLGDVEMVEFDGVFREVEGLIKEMMPRTRADMIDYVKEFNPLRLTSGALDPTDNIIFSYYLRSGLEEGWLDIDPDLLRVYENRAIAAMLDESDRLADAGAFADSASAMKGVPVDVYEVENVIAKEAPVGIDAEQAAKAAEQEFAQSPEDIGRQLADAEARRAAEQVASAEAAEQGRELRQTIMAANPDFLAEMDDDVVVREILGLDLNEVEGPYVDKLANRRWGVFDNDGELMEEVSTKKAADQLADKELRKRREGVVARARQVAADREPRPVEFTWAGDAPLSPSIKEKVKLTAAQIDMLGGAGDPTVVDMIQRELDRLRGEGAWSQLAPGTKRQLTFELNMQQIANTIDEIDRIIAEGDVTGMGIGGRRVRVLKNLRDKLQEVLDRMGPEARAQRWAEDRAMQALEFIENGEVCTRF